MASCPSAHAGEKNIEISFFTVYLSPLKPQNTPNMAPNEHSVSSVHMVDTGVFRSPFRLTLFSPACFPQPCFPQPCFPRTCLLRQLFPQSTSLSLLPSTFLHAFPYHLSLNTSQPANLFALLNLRELTRIIYRPTLATLWDLNLLTPVPFLFLRCK